MNESLNLWNLMLTPRSVESELLDTQLVSRILTELVSDLVLEKIPHIWCQKELKNTNSKSFATSLVISSTSQNVLSTTVSLALGTVPGILFHTHWMNRNECLPPEYKSSQLLSGRS